MKILSLVGARPQYIKEAILNHEFKKNGIREVLVNSGQHYDFNMSDIFFESLDIKKPDYNLKVGSGNHGEMTGKIMAEFEKVAIKEKPDIIVVYGDTNTTLAGAIVAAKLKIKLAHVEAGLRMLPKDMPEEVNRVLTDHISNYLFAPSKRAVSNLKKEGIIRGVRFTGDITYDLYLKMKPKFKYDLFKKLGLKQNGFGVVTIHRDYNVDYKDKLEIILNNLNLVNKKLKLVFPMHPRTRKRMEEFGFNNYLNGLYITEPIDYLELMGLVNMSSKVITDSGGLQKEAYFSGKRAVVLMPDTGWSELIDCRWNVLSNGNDLYKKVFSRFSSNLPKYIYGKGDSGKLMVNILSSLI